MTPLGADWPKPEDLDVHPPQSDNPSPSKGLLKATSGADIEKQIIEILIAVEGHGQYHTSAYDGPVMTVRDANQQILALLESSNKASVVAELEKAHRAGNTTDYDNATDEYIDERIAELKATEGEQRG